MTILTRLRANLRYAASLFHRLRDRGYGTLESVLWRLPGAVLLRGYRKLAYRINDGLLHRFVTTPRFVRFQEQSGPTRDGCFYIIVMPDTLHFLLPCLSLVAGDAQVILLLNGTRRWESDVLRERWPRLPQCRMATLPGSSIGHGAMITLLLKHCRHDFGLLDHDLYLLDRSVLQQRRFAPDECLLCLFGDSSADGKWAYPLTHYLYFRIAVFANLMRRFDVDARIYRTVPVPARAHLRSIGLRDGETMKSYHDFFDTLQLLIALAYADGLAVAQIQSAEDKGAYHVGGTSIGTHHTKDLVDLYVHLRFLELSDDAQLRRRYAALVAPFSAAADIRARIPLTLMVAQKMAVIDATLDRLGQAIEDGRRGAG